MSSGGYVKGSKTYEMQWDCKFCGTKKLLGKTHRFCPNCGAQQDPSWRYFPSDEEKVAVEDHVYVGADKVCAACQTVNAARSEFCGNCGAPLDVAAQAAQGAQRERGEGESFTTEDLERKREQLSKPAAAAAKAEKPAGSSRAFILFMLLAIVVCGGAIYLFTRTTSAPAYVTGFRWERSIDIEALQAVPGRSDCNAVPVGAYGVSQRYEQVGTQRVQDGETCRVRQVDQGDGTFREERVCQPTYRDEPVYGYRCYYTINTWVQSRTVRSQGDKETPLIWPPTNLNAGNCLGCEREGGRSERYFLTLRTDEGKNFECVVPFDLWQSTDIERGFTVEIGSLLGDVRCETLRLAG